MSLIIVPCHSIWKQDFVNLEQGPNVGLHSEQWFLAPFQHEGNDHLAFIKHGLYAIRLFLEQYDISTVIFSGSQTKFIAGPISEAQSYYFLMEKLIRLHLKRQLPSLPDHAIESCLKDIELLMEEKGLSLSELFSSRNITTEEFALDSFDNLLYSILRYEQIKGKYPEKIKIVGFGFKKERFIGYHAKAIDFPKNAIEYLSVDPEPVDYDDKKLKDYFNELNKLEKKNALDLFSEDWYGVKFRLFPKKQSRNPFIRIPHYKFLQKECFNPAKLGYREDEQYFKDHIEGAMPWSVNK